MSGKFLARASALSLAMLLVACGGDESSSPLAGTDDQQSGSGDTNTGGSTGGGIDTDGDGEIDTTIGSLKISASPVQIGTSNNASSEILVFVRDQNNVLVQNVPVEFRVDADATIQKVRSTTDESGTAEAILTTPQNPKNRAATVTAEAGGIESAITINITGTTLSLDGPTNISAGNTATYTATLTDSDGNGIPVETISIDTSISNGGTLYTDDQGETSFTLTPTAAGTYPLQVSAFSGESKLTSALEISVSDSDFTFSSPAPGAEIAIDTLSNLTFAWTEDGSGQAGQDITFSITRGLVNGGLSHQDTTDGNGEITTTISSSSAGPATIVARNEASNLTTSMNIEFVATTPDKLITQASRTQLKPGEQSRITAILRDANNNLVKGKRVLFTIEDDISNGFLSSPDGVTDSLGRVSTVFTAGNSGTGVNGTVITALVQEDSTINDSANLTISSGAYRLTIGTGNTLTEEDDDHYLKNWVVFVSDANGQPVENASVELSVLPTKYFKGTWQPGFCSPSATDPDCWVRQATAECPAEDVNYNGEEDPGEDINGSGHLEPSYDAVAVSGSETSADDGSYHFSLKYPQSACGWTEVIVTAKVNVEGTEFSESGTTLLSCSSADLTNMDATPPSFNGGSRYGTSNSCFDDQ
ncbi:Ig-like domain-containing protein [Marinobacter sp.]|uniref:Ig-like domain-containing protein n=1 Tax=Marinobacter sp. TaxID=50741 RepID=UPI0035642296